MSKGTVKKENKDISYTVIRRLPRYLRYLEELKEKGIYRISSKELSEKMGVTASQIRQDLNNFGCFGQQGYGYRVDTLLDEINKILALNVHKTAIIVGAGNIGKAILNYETFKNQVNFDVVGIFDNDFNIIGKKINGLEVTNVDFLEDFVAKKAVDILILAVPNQVANKVVERACAAGIKAVWNFVSKDLPVPKGVIIENVHLADSLMVVSYRLMNESDN